MRVRVLDGAKSRDLEVLHLARRSVGDLAEACGFDPCSGVVVDGVLHPATANVADVDLAHGSVLAAASSRSGTATPPLATTAEADATAQVNATGGVAVPVARLHHIGGWSAGGHVDLTPGDHALGRADVADLSPGDASAARAFLRVTANGTQVRAAGTNSVLVDGRDAAASGNAHEAVVTTGGSAFTVTEIPDQVAAPAGPILHSRPPRTITPVVEPSMQLPLRPRDARGREALSWAMIIAPIPIGIVMVLVFNSLLFAMFMVFSPVMALARWWEGRSKSKKDTRRFSGEMRSTLDDVRRNVAQASHDELHRRRRAQPHAAELRERARLGDPRLWERRRAHEDAFTAIVGWVDEPFNPELRGDASFPEAEAIIASGPMLAAVPLLADFDEHRAVGVAGPRPLALAVARSLIAQLCTLHGPADLELVLCAEPDRVDDWDGLKWLPHIGGHGGARVVTTLDDVAEEIAGVGTRPGQGASKWTEEDETPVGAALVAVVDGPAFVATPGAALRAKLADPAADLMGLVVGATVEELPASCGLVVHIDERGAVTVQLPGEGRTVAPVLPVGVSVPAAHDWFRSLARFADPEASGGNAGIPASIDLTDLVPSLDPADIADAWGGLPDDPKPDGVIGVTDRGTLSVDLATDGPHALIAGTTGSGKSELLRSMVASMALRTDPTHLNFVLIDFKGGGAFDLCAALPHVVSVVTDLDEHLAERALRCLKAELRWREELLRAHEATDLPEYLAAGNDPLPRLVVIIDEFATLAVELPDFMGSLVDIAQRGRSLGVHMVLATQRPSGVLDNKIRANTNLRIALRVQDENDSVDVIGTDAASRLSRNQPGRAFARFGSTEITEFQAALVTGAHVPVAERFPEAHPFSLLSRARAMQRDATEVTDVEVISDAIAAANEACGYAPPRVPWPDPLPEQVDAAGLTAETADAEAAGGWVAPVGRIDLPDRQQQLTWSWSPAVGNMVLYGVSSTDTALTTAAIALRLAHELPPSKFHLYVFDAGVGSLAPLEGLEHCGAFVTADDLERVLRGIGLLEAELAARRDLAAADRGALVDLPMVMVLAENYGGIVEMLEEERHLDAASRLAQIVRDGPQVGMFTFLTASHERSVPSRVANLVERKLVFRMADPNSYTSFGLRPKDVPDLGAQRALDMSVAETVQFGRFADGDLAAAVSQVRTGRAPAERLPAPIRTFADHVEITETDHPDGIIDEDSMILPIAIAAEDLTPFPLRLSGGEHAIVAGTSGSGRSTALAAIAARARLLDQELPIIAVTPRRSPLRRMYAVDRWLDNNASPTELNRLIDVDEVLVLVDDAETLVDELASVLVDVAGRRSDRRHMFAASRPDWIRDVVSWPQPLRSSRTGIVLQPNVTDGDVLRTMLPMSKPERFPVGRGFIILNGHATLMQVALAAPDVDVDLAERGPTIDLSDSGQVGEALPSAAQSTTGQSTTGQSTTGQPFGARAGGGLEALAALAAAAPAVATVAAEPESGLAALAAIAQSTTDERLTGLLDELRPGHHAVIAGPTTRVEAALEDLIAAAATRKLEVAVVADPNAAAALVEGVGQVFSPASSADLGLLAVALATADVIVIADADDLNGSWVDVVAAATTRRSTPVRFIAGVADRNDSPEWLDSLQTHDGDVLIETSL